MPPRKAAPTCQRTAHFCVNSVRMFLRFTLRGSSASTVNSSNIIILFSIISLSKDYHYYYYYHHHHHQHNNIGTYDLKKTEHLRMHTLRCQIISQAVQLLYSLLPRVNEDVKSLFFFFLKPCYTPGGVFFWSPSIQQQQFWKNYQAHSQGDKQWLVVRAADRKGTPGQSAWVLGHEKSWQGPLTLTVISRGGISGDHF